MIPRGRTYHGKQDFDYFAGISAEKTGAKGLCLHMVTIPPRGRAKPHLHEAGMWYGEGLSRHVWVQAGDFLYIPANVPHLPYNPSEDTPCVGLVARTDPNEQESVTLLDLTDPGVAGRPAVSAAQTTSGNRAPGA